MTDTTTPVDVIARGLTGTFDLQRSDWVGNQYRVETTIGPVSADILATAIITALRDAGYEIVRVDREPDAPEITEAMIEAAARVFFTWNGLTRQIPEPNLKTQPVWKIAHAAIDAALKARG